MSESFGPIDVTATPLHLGLGGTAAAIADFAWAPERLAAYEEATRSDGSDGRMVMMFESTGPWDSWECHPAGHEVVVACSGRHRFALEIDGAEVEVEIGPGEALVNPPGVWHTCVASDGGWILTITPGLGTDHRPRG